MTDAGLRDAAVKELKLTTAGWRKPNGNPNYPSGEAPPTTHWGKAMALLDQIGAEPEPEPPPVGTRPWAASSPINTLIPSNPQVVLGYNTGPLNGLPGLGLNGGGWGVAVFRDTSGTRRTITNPNWKLDNVPMPAQWPAYWDAMNALGDQEKHHIVIDGDRVHNVYNANRAYTSCGAMGEMRALNVSSGFWRNSMGPWLGRSSGFCSATGTVLKSELDAGVIEHVLSVGWPSNRISSTVLPPADTSDGTGGSGGIPMGAWLQLDPNLTETQIKGFGISSYYLPLAKAMQKYGCFVCESTDWMTIYAESWNDSGKVTWPDGWYPASKSLLPRLRMVAPPPAPVFDDRTVFNQPHT